MDIYKSISGESLHIDLPDDQSVEFSIVSGSLQVVVDNRCERAGLYLYPCLEALVAIRNWAIEQAGGADQITRAEFERRLAEVAESNYVLRNVLPHKSWEELPERLQKEVFELVGYRPVLVFVPVDQLEEGGA